MSERKTRAGDQDRPWRALGARIRDLRIAQRMSQREFARRIPVSSGYLANIEPGKRRPEAMLLRRIAVVLGTSYDDLAVLAGYLPPQPAGAITITAPGDDPPTRQRLARLPLQAAQALIHLWDLWSLDHDPVIGRLLGFNGEASGAGEPERKAGSTGR